MAEIGILVAQDSRQEISRCWGFLAMLRFLRWSAGGWFGSGAGFLQVTRSSFLRCCWRFPAWSGMVSANWRSTWMASNRCWFDGDTCEDSSREKRAAAYSANDMVEICHEEAPLLADADWAPTAAPINVNIQPLLRTDTNYPLFHIISPSASPLSVLIVSKSHSSLSSS